MMGAAPAGTLSATLGYEPVLLAELSRSSQQELELVSAAWCWAVAGLSAPLAYCGWLLTHGAWTSVSVGIAALIMLMQIVRLTVAGAGLSASAGIETLRGYRPAWTPVLWFVLLGAMFAQPAQLPLWQREHSLLVAAERSKLLAVHARALEALSIDPRAASHDSYARELGDNEFLVLRLCSLWSNPRRAAPYTLLYLAIVLGPLVFAQLYGRRALCRYQWLRVQRSRRAVAADSRRTEERVAASLTRYTSYAPPVLDASRDDTALLRKAWPWAREDREAKS